MCKGAIDKATTLNKFFASVSRTEPFDAKRERKIVAQTRATLGDKNLESVPSATEQELDRALRQMARGKAPGSDNIPVEMLVELGPLARETLRKLHTASLAQGVTPASWRQADVVPIAKPTKNHSTPDGCRSISLTSAVAKVIERIIGNRLRHAIEHKLNTVQAGFRPFRCAQEQGGYLLQTIFDGFNTLGAGPHLSRRVKKRCLLCCVDTSKAYDRVWKYGLYDKLLQIGVDRHIVEWCRGFLHDRLCRVKCDGAYSPYAHLRAGLPQGSVLAPLLYLVYVNDLPRNLPANILPIRNADDLALATLGDSPGECERQMQAGLDALKGWTDKNHMAVDVAKCTSTMYSLSSKENFGKSPIRLLLPHKPDYTSAHESVLDAIWWPDCWGMKFRDNTQLEVDMTCTLAKQIGYPVWLTQVNGMSVSCEREATAQIKLGINIFIWSSCVPHVAVSLVSAHPKRCNLLRRLAGANWGPSPSLIRQTNLCWHCTKRIGLQPWCGMAPSVSECTTQVGSLPDEGGQTDKWMFSGNS